MRCPASPAGICRKWDRSAPRWWIGWGCESLTLALGTAGGEKNISQPLTDVFIICCTEYSAVSRSFMFSEIIISV